MRSRIHRWSTAFLPVTQPRAHPAAVGYAGIDDLDQGLIDLHLDDVLAVQGSQPGLS
jgi:hypothetical protein